MSFYQKLWSDYQQHIFKSPILYAHYKNQNIDNTVQYLFLVSSIFEKISDRAITLRGDIPITIVTTLFYECSHPSSNGAFTISLSGKACIGFDKNCFIKCQSPSVGVGSVRLVKHQCLSVIDCVISQSVYPQQRDTFSVHDGVQYYKSFNSSYNEVSSAPHITSVGAFSCELKYCIISHNFAKYHGGMYIASESMFILLGIFMSNSISDQSTIGIVCADGNSEVTIASSDFSQNKGYLFSASGQSFIACKQCFFNSNSASLSYSGVTIETTSIINKEEIWIVDQNVCHQRFHSCKEGRRRQMIFLSFVMSE